MRFIPLLCLQHIDPHLGRISAETLDDQQMMELLVQDVSLNTFKQFASNAAGEFNDKCEWIGVTCDKDGAVQEVLWQFKPLRSIAHLDFIPRTTKVFIMHKCAATGTLDTAKLPGGLTELSIGANVFHGSVDLRCLPDQMHTLGIHGNDFSGSLDFTSLPKTLEALYVSQNGFSGSVRLDCLPERQEALWLYSNKFCGSLCLENLPSGMKHIDASGNDFSGSLCFEKLPGSIQRLLFSKNNFSGSISLSRLPSGIAQLSIDNNALSGSFIMDAPVSDRISVDASCNDFSGVAVVPYAHRWGVNIFENPLLERIVDLEGNEIHHELIH